MDLFENEPASQYDVLEIRHALEGTAAYHAAIRATDSDRENARRRFETMIAMHEAGEPEAEIQADTCFHLSIVEAAHNQVLLQVMRGLFELLQKSIGRNLDQLYQVPRVFEPLSRQHENLMEAVVEGNPQRARAAAQEHMIIVEETLHRLEREKARRGLTLRHLSESQAD